MATESEEDRPPLDANRPWYLEYEWEALDHRRLDERGSPIGRRPLYCDGERMRALLGAIEEGLYPTDAAAAAGLGRTSFFEWRANVPVVSDAIRDAEVVAKGKLLKVIRNAMPTNWQAAAWMAERRWPHEWGRRDRVQHQVEGVIGLQIKPAEMTVEAITLAAALEEELSMAEEALLALPAHESEN